MKPLYLAAPYGSPEDTDFDVFWRAFSRRNDLTTPLLIKVQGEGSTAEDAVAKLWLKLNVEAAEKPPRSFNTRITHVER